jgi:hypothetical protein
MKTPHIARECPRWIGCSVNNCPLDTHETHADDKDLKCPMEKGVRLRIVEKYPGVLKLGGLTPREWSSRQAWERLSPSVKADRLKRASDIIAKLNADKRA